MNHLKTPVFQSLGKAIKKRYNDFSEIQGKALPCTIVEAQGSIVRVAFDIDTTFTLPQVTMPVSGSVYARVPLQPGDRGLAIPADIPIAGTAGLGGGLTNMRPSSNLGALIFLPMASATWDAVDPGTFVLTDATGASKMELASDGITLSFGAHTVVIDATGVTIDGVAFLLHTHSGVTTGSGASGPVVP